MVALNQITALFTKDVIQVVRNRKILALLLFYPVFSALIVPHIINFDSDIANVAYVDNDNSELSRSITEALYCMEGEATAVQCNTFEQALSLLDEAYVDCILEIPAGYERTMVSTEKLPELSLSLNAVEPVRALLGSRKILGTVGNAILENTGQKGVTISASRSYITESHYYNPSLDYLLYMLPVVLISIALYLCTNVTGTSMSNEIEGGGLDIINSSPMSRTVFVSSKLLTCYLFGLVEMLYTMFLLQFAHDMTPSGSVLLVVAAFSLFVLGLSATTILIGNLTANGTLTLLLSYMYTTTIQLMSGFFTPVENMHKSLQYLSYLNPCRHLVEILRNVYLKSSTLSDLHSQFLWLAALTVITCFLTVVTYRKRSA